MRNLNFYVAPRYTAGSPALVSESIARKVAADERNAYETTLEGAYGERFAAEAKRDGLGGIVEEQVEFSKGWHITDLITGRRYDKLVAVKPKKVEYSDTLLDVNTSGYSFLPLYTESYAQRGKSTAFPFLVCGIEKVKDQYIFADGEGRRLIVPKDSEFKLEREERT